MEILKGHRPRPYKLSCVYLGILGIADSPAIPFTTEIIAFCVDTTTTERQQGHRAELPWLLPLTGGIK